MNRLAPLAFATLLAASASAQTPQFTDPANLRGERVRPRDGRELPIDGGQGNAALGLQQLLRKLATRASILNVVAHPDDEDGGMLTLYARGLGARVADISLTRGEGGQNAVTSDFDDALGLLRTQELLANDRYTGVDQMFGTEVDFGFSKTKSEAFSKWTHERVLYDVVRAIRLFRPLIITATFIGNPTDGHGQHQVSGETAQEAFLAAGDPGIFPELTAEGILPWQPLKMYARVPEQAISERGLFDYATGQYVPAKFTNYITRVTTTTPPTTDIIVHEGTPDPLLTPSAANVADLPENYTDPHAPLSYVQFARIGLGLQKSQIGPGVRNASTGLFDVPYHLYGSRICDPSHPDVVILSAAKDPCISPVGSETSGEPDFFRGIDTSLDGMASSEPGLPESLRQRVQQLAVSIRAATESFDASHPAAIAPALAAALKQLQAIEQDIAPEPFRSPRFPAFTHELSIKSVELQEALALALDVRVAGTSDAAEMVANAPIQVDVRITTPPESSPDTVFFAPARQADIRYVSTCPPNGAPLGLGTFEPFTSPLVRECPFVSTERVTRPYFTRPNLEQPFYDLRTPELRNAAMSPPAVAVISVFGYRGARFEVDAVVEHGRQATQIVPVAALATSAHAQVLPNTANSTRVSTFFYPLTLPRGLPEVTVPAGWTVTPAINDADAPGQMSLQLNAPASHRTPFTLTASAKVFNDFITEGYRPVGYGDLPRTNYYTPATDRIVPVDLKLPIKNRIAFLPGTGDAVPGSLASIGLQPTMLTVADLTPARLAQFDTVILGVRTYSAHPDLHGAPTQALLDFARTGGNVVVQYQTAEFTGADAPFPLSLGRDAEKVVDEAAPVHLLSPSAPALSSPNKLTEADFNGWIEERGHGFLRTWSDQYTALTETHDPGSVSEGVAAQAPQRGGLITVQLGKGHWTYCAFALYRQLPEAVPGSYRLFANLLALADQR